MEGRMGSPDNSNNPKDNKTFKLSHILAGNKRAHRLVMDNPINKLTTDSSTNRLSHNLSNRTHSTSPIFNHNHSIYRQN
jgi:hypothetical protein